MLHPPQSDIFSKRKWIGSGLPLKDILRTISEIILRVSFKNCTSVGRVRKFYLADHRVNFPNFGSFLISFLHSKKLYFLMRGLLPIVTVIKFATENYKNLISKENFFENSSFFVIHLKNTKSGHVIFFSIF